MIPEIIISVAIGIAAGLFGSCAILGILSRAIEWLTPIRHPACDIDPRLHPGFAWGKDGKAYIGQHEVSEPFY